MVFPLADNHGRAVAAFVDSVVIGFGIVTIFTVVAVWIASVLSAANSPFHKKPAAGAAKIGLADPARATAGSAGRPVAAADMGALPNGDWASAIATISSPGPMPPKPRSPVAPPRKIASLQSQPQTIPVKPEAAHVSNSTQVASSALKPARRSAAANAKLPPGRADDAPLKLVISRSALPHFAHPSSRRALPRVAAVVPETRVARLPVPGKSKPLLDVDNRTAVYDIAAHTVYMPDGAELEAHSGLGNRLDDPRYVRVRDQGPTPPNVYNLALREQLFHDVRAIRLNPIDPARMFGRSGMLAHPYMLGANGQSNGCVSFKDYPAFLHAYLNGEVARLVVVPHIDKASLLIARTRRDIGRRYAENNF